MQHAVRTALTWRINARARSTSSSGRRLNKDCILTIALFLFPTAGHCAAKRRQHSGPLVYITKTKRWTFCLTKCPLAEFFLGRVLSHIPFQKKIHRNFSQVRNSNCLSLITWPIWYQFLYLFFSNFLNWNCLYRCTKKKIEIDGNWVKYTTLLHGEGNKIS
jgi:hypothetical protein